MTETAILEGVRPLPEFVSEPVEIILISRRRPFRWRTVFEITVMTILTFLFVEAFVVQGYRVYGSCMEPNLVTGERLLGSKIACRLTGVKRGDIVIFRPPLRGNVPYVKRVIGMPGELLEIRNSQVYINGRRLKESYLHRVWHDDRAPQRIPDDKVFVMGDNRDNSSDSRAWGLLPVENIDAKAWLRYWPLERVEVLN